MRLLTAQAANGSGEALAWFGGRGVFASWGTFGGGTCKLEWSPDEGTTWVAVDRTGDTYVSLTATGAGEFILPGCKIRATLSGATGATVSASAEPA